MLTRHCLSLAGYVCLFAGAAWAQPWSTPFAKDIPAFRQAAAGIKTADKDGVHVLLDEHRFVIDASGRVTRTMRLVYRVAQEDYIEMWSSLEQVFEPWHQAKPQLRARVIAADGSVHLLDPKTISEAPVAEYDSSVYSDSRVLRAPLPAIKPGAIVETEVILRDTATRFSAGIAERIWVKSHVPGERFHVIVEAPSSIPLKSLIRLMPDTALRQTSNGRNTIAECDYGPYRPPTKTETALPPDIAPSAYFAFSTAASWKDVASQYSALVETQIRNANLSAVMPSELPPGDLPKGEPRQIAETLTARLHDTIRYTGVEFGEAAIVPRTPAETLRRGYGDCKDKAALLVAMLRAAGLNAQVALLLSGNEKDLDAELPGFGLFNHAIVYVDGAQPFWIDATANDSRIANLPLGDTERLALIAAPTTSGLTLTPGATSAANRRTHEVEVWMSSLGRGKIIESIAATGFQDTTLRTAYTGSGNGKDQEAIANYAKVTYLSKQLGDIHVTPRKDIATDFRMKVEMKEAGRAVTDHEEAGVATLPYLLFADVPWILSAPEQEGVEQGPREQPALMFQPHLIEYRYLIHPPALFRPVDLPESGEWQFGPATYSRKVNTLTNGDIQIDYRFDTGKRRLTAVEFEAFRAGLKEHNKQEAELIRFGYIPGEHFGAGESTKALAILRAHASANPKDANAQIRLSRALIAAGVTGAAIQAATKATELNPKSAQSWNALGWAYQHDPFGRRMRGEWNRSAAGKAYAKSMEIDPDDLIAPVDLAIMHEFNDAGERYGKGSNLQEAARIYKRILEKGPNAVLRSNLVAALLFDGAFDELRKLLSPQPGTDMERGVLLAIEAVRLGSARALAGPAATIADPSVKSQVLLSAASNLMMLRKYDAAREFLHAAIRLRVHPEAQARFDFLSKVKTVESTLFSDSDPRSVVQKLFLQLIDTDTNEASLGSFSGERRAFAALRAQFSSIGIPGQMLPDVLVSNIEFSKDGDDEHGYQISAGGQTGAAIPDLFVIKENDGYRILCSVKSMANVGKLVQDLLEKGNLKRAQVWLDRAAKEASPTNGEGTGYPAIRYLWAGVKEETRGPDAARTAVAALISAELNSPESIAILKQAHAKAATDMERKHLEIALCQAYGMAKDWTALRETARSLRAHNFFADDGRRYYWQALLHLEQWPELRKEAEPLLAKYQDDIQGLRALARSLYGEGKLKEAAERYVAASKSILAESSDKIAALWISLLAEVPLDGLETVLGKENNFNVKASPGYWYALAAAQSAQGKTSDSHRTLLNALDRDRHTSLDAQPWLVYGQICLQLGMTAEARMALERAAKVKGAEPVDKWVSAIAARDLAKAPADLASAQ